MIRRLGRILRRMLEAALHEADGPRPKPLEQLADDKDWKIVVGTINKMATRIERLEQDQLRLAQKTVNLASWTHDLVSALVRHAYVDGATVGPSAALPVRRFRIYSQHGEDGMLVELFRRAGATNRRSVEIGCGLNGGNTGFLVKECGWTGLMVDGEASKVEEVRARYSGSDVTAVAASVTCENINDLIRDHGFAGPVDVLSIDIDGVDYWLWNAIDCIDPRVVVIEYNWLLGPDRAVTVPYRPDFDINASGYRAYRGASLKALAYLARRKGYRLVATEFVNAFFVRNDVAPDLPTAEPERVFRASPTKGVDPYLRFDQRGLELVEVEP